MAYTCTKEGDKGIFEVKHKKGDGCRCRKSEGYYWDEDKKDCLKVKCLIPKSEFNEEILDCIDSSIFNDNDEYEAKYTGNWRNYGHY